MSIRRLVLVLAMSGLAGTANAADFSDPTWPCIQRKVDQMSIGLMWPYPVEEDAELDPDLQKDIQEMAELLALRRLELEELEPRVAAFADRHDGDPRIMSLVFAQVFGSLSKRRTRIIDGIGDFSLSQIGLSEKIESARVEMDAELKASEPDYDRVDALEEQIDWDQTIYTDRQQSITYLCETPTLLERRLYSIARMLQNHTSDGG